MVETRFLDWPFFDDRHRQLAAELEGWCAARAALLARRPAGEAPDAADALCRVLVRALAADGWLRHCVPAAFGGASERLEVRSLCLVREILARHAALADFAFAMQGLGSATIALFGSDWLRQRYLPEVARGERICAFALSEPEAGSDVAALATTARRDGTFWILNGEKTWISNGGIADHYVLFARTGEGPGTRGISAFVVDAQTPGLEVVERIATIAPHPLARLRLADCRVPAEQLVGEAGAGFRYAMATLEIFRPTVGAAALGMARAALATTLARVTRRRLFGGPMSGLAVVQEKLADMATAIDAAALLVYRAAWEKDRGRQRIDREAAMAKLFATEMAQRVVDEAVQLAGGLGVTRGSRPEELYREIRALRIYEGASEIQRLVIARDLLRALA
ncbi:putative acyl-CoA dehydrogenase fadE25 [bacterium HR40]|nr:putative acyl-CoA dehydrogenase fadE25 [bacterium HR40]